MFLFYFFFFRRYLIYEIPNGFGTETFANLINHLIEMVRYPYYAVEALVCGQDKLHYQGQALLRSSCSQCSFNRYVILWTQDLKSGFHSSIFVYYQIPKRILKISQKYHKNISWYRAVRSKFSLVWLKNFLRWRKF